MLWHLFQCQSEIDTEYIYDNTQHRRNHIYYMLLIFPSPYRKAIPCSHSHQCYYISTPQQPLAGQTEQRLNARSYERSPASALWSAFTHTGKRIWWNRKMPHDQTYARRINRKGNFKIAVLQVGFFRNQGGGPAWGMGVHLAPDSFLKSSAVNIWSDANTNSID